MVIYCLMDHMEQGWGTEIRKESIAIKSHKMIVAQTKIVIIEVMRYIVMVGLIINSTH